MSFMRSRPDGLVAVFAVGGGGAGGTAPFDSPRDGEQQLFMSKSAYTLVGRHVILLRKSTALSFEGAHYSDSASNASKRERVVGRVEGHDVGEQHDHPRRAFP